MGKRKPLLEQSEVRDAVEKSRNLTGALRRLGLRAAGGNYRTLRRAIDYYGVSTEHLEPFWMLQTVASGSAKPLNEVLVERSTYNRGKLKERLYATGLKERRCEICGQDEMWRGQPMALIIDHINGVGDDNRLENLRIVCPNCAATLDTHCGRQGRILFEDRACLHCGQSFRPRYQTHRYCSRSCGVHHGPGHHPRS